MWVSTRSTVAAQMPKAGTFRQQRVEAPAYLRTGVKMLNSKPETTEVVP